MKHLKGLAFAFITLLSFVCGSTGVFASDGPSVDMDSNGNAVAAWTTVTNDGAVIQANIKLGTSWDSPQTLSTPNNNVDYPRLKVTPNGSDISAVVIWGQMNGDVTSLYAAMLPSSVAGWTNPVQISSSTENIVGSNQYFVHVNAAGDILATWSSLDELGNQYVRSASSQIGFSNAWSSPAYVSGP